MVRRSMEWMVPGPASPEDLRVKSWDRERPRVAGTKYWYEWFCFAAGNSKPYHWRSCWLVNSEEAAENGIEKTVAGNVELFQESFEIFRTETEWLTSHMVFVHYSTATLASKERLVASLAAIRADPNLLSLPHRSFRPLASLVYKACSARLDQNLAWWRYRREYHLRQRISSSSYGI